MAKITPNPGKNMEQKELSGIAGRNTKWYDHFGRQFGSFFIKLNTLMITSHSLMFIQMSQKLASTGEKKKIGHTGL